MIRHKIFSLILLLLTISCNQLLFGDTCNCYNYYVLGHYYSLSTQLDMARPGFAVPVSMYSSSAQERLFGEPGLLERDNLWVYETRKERFQEALLNIACLADYKPEQIKAFQKRYLEAAPAALKNTPLYDLLNHYFAQTTLDVNNTMADIQSRYRPIDNVASMFQGIIKIVDLPPGNIPSQVPEIVDFFRDTPFHVYDDPLMWTKIREWLKPIGEAAKVANTIGDIVALTGTSYDIVITVFWGQLMANEAAIERLEHIKNALQQDAGLWNDPALRDAVLSVEEFLYQSDTQQAIEYFLESIRDNASEIYNGGKILARVLVGQQAVEYIRTLAQAHHIASSTLGGWSIGLLALEKEFLLILGIQKQLENAELSVCAATIAKALCAQTNNDCKLDVPAMYGYLLSANYVVDAFDWEPLWFWKFGDTVDIWNDAIDLFTQKLNEEYLHPCDFNSPLVYITSPNDGDIVCSTITIEALAFDDVTVDKVEFYIGNNKKADVYSRPFSYDWDSSLCSGTIKIEAIAYDDSGNTNSDTIFVTVENSLNITHNGPWSATAGGTFSINGSLTDALGCGISGVTVYAKINGSVIGQGITGAAGDYTISSASAPIAAGPCTVDLEANCNGNSVEISDTLNVISISEGYEIRISNFNVEPFSVQPGERVTIDATVDNVSNRTGVISGDLIFKLGNQTSTYHFSRDQGQSTGLQSADFYPSSDGSYTAQAYLTNLNRDTDPSNNNYTTSVYVGQNPDYDYYNVYSDVKDVGASVAHGGYTITVINTYDDGSAKYSINGSADIWLDEGEFYEDYDGGQVVIWHEGTYNWGTTKRSFWETWVVNTNQTTITPTNLQVTQGQNNAYYIITTGGISPSNIGPSQATSDGQTINSWGSWSKDTIDSNHYKAEFDVPSNAAVRTYNYWLEYSLSGDSRAQEVQLTVNPSHDVSISNVSPNSGTHFGIGASIPISASVNAGNGYTEQPNIVLNITNTSGYSYNDNETPTVSGSQSVSFSPNWSTTGLSPGVYSITVSASIGNDINSGNNSQSVTVTLDPPPALTVNAQSTSSTYEEGDTIELWATVIGNGMTISDASVVAHLTWPDTSVTNPIMSWDTVDSRYECTLLGSQTGTCSGSVSANKSGFTQGSDPIESFVISNSAPDTTITSTYPTEGESVTDCSVRFTWIANDFGTPTSQLQYSWKVDGGTWSPWSTETSSIINIYTGGPHTLYVKSFDGFLEDPTPAQRTFIILPFQYHFEITRLRYGAGTQELYGWWSGTVWPPTGKVLTEATITLPNSTVLGGPVSGLGIGESASMDEEDVFGSGPVLLSNIENMFTTGVYTIDITCSDGTSYSYQFTRQPGMYPNWPVVQQPTDLSTNELPLTISWEGTDIDWIEIVDPVTWDSLLPVEVGPQSPYVVPESILQPRQTYLLTVDRNEVGSYLGSATLVRFDTAGSCSITGDFDADCDVDIDDLVILLENWLAGR